MSKIAIAGATTGTGTFTLASPATNTDRVLTLPDEAGTVLTTAGVPASAMPAGSVIQVVSVAKTDTWSATTQAFTDITGLSATITPRDANSKILVILDLNIGTEISNAAIPRIVRNGNAIYVGDAAGSRPRGLGQPFAAINTTSIRHGGVYLDSPSTASAVTYKAQLRSTGLVAQYVNRTNRDTDLADYDARGSSSITLMEIAG